MGSQKQETQKLNLQGDLSRFALAFYGRPGIAEACLRLQDKAGVDVVALIAVLYADVVLLRGCNEHDIAELQALTTRWREETVLPLRRVRRALKQPPQEFPPEETEALRSMIKKAELRSEMIQLAISEEWLLKRPPRAGMPLEQAVTLLSHAPCQNDDIAEIFAQIVTSARETARMTARRSNSLLDQPRVSER